jgi:hypothetical protein
MVMTDERRSGRALIEVTPQMMERLRDPRTLLGFALVAAGAVAVVVGYFGVSGRTSSVAGSAVSSCWAAGRC